MRIKLKRLRKKYGWSADLVAQKVGLKRRMYVYIESGKRNPSLTVANRLEDLFGVPQRELLVLDDNTESNSETQKTPR